MTLPKLAERPGYFGRRKLEKHAELDQKYGQGNWRLVWVAGGHRFNFLAACRYAYEFSYFQHFQMHPEQLDYICSFGECIDNAPTNIQCGTDYSIQEAFSTHIQDIAIRNVMYLMGRKFKGLPEDILTIRGEESNGWRFNPGQIPFCTPSVIEEPSLRPDWAKSNSVEDFWQSNKWVEVLPKQVELVVVGPETPPPGVEVDRTKCTDCGTVFKDPDDGIATVSHTPPNYVTLCQPCYRKRGNTVR